MALPPPHTCCIHMLETYTSGILKHKNSYKINQWLQKQKAQVNADSASSLYLNHLRQRTSRPAMTKLNYYRLLHL